MINSSLRTFFFSGSFNVKEIKGGEDGFISLKMATKEDGVGWGWTIYLVSKARCFRWRSGGVGENMNSGTGESSGFNLFQEIVERSTR